MQLKFITAASLICILAACQPQQNSPVSNNQNQASAAKDSVSNQKKPSGEVEKNIQDALMRAYPDQKVQIKSVGESPIANLYEVVVFPNQVVYMDAKGEHMFVGNLLDMKTQTNLTEEKIAELNSIDYQALPFESAIKEVRGNGQYKVAVFSDPDCPFCKRLEHEIAKMTDVTVYTFLMPIASLHPDAIAKSEQIWCQSDRTSAWIKWMREDVAPTQVPTCKNPVADLIKLSEGFGFNGTPTIVYPNGKVHSGYMPQEAFEKAIRDNQSK